MFFYSMCFVALRPGRTVHCAYGVFPPHRPFKGLLPHLRRDSYELVKENVWCANGFVSSLFSGSGCIGATPIALESHT